MEKRTYAKLSALVDQDFTVEKVWGYRWQKYDEGSGKYLRADKWEQGFSKRWDIVSDKGQFDVSPSNYGSMLEGVSKEGKADINGKTFHVKSNGKSGMEIRYWINPVFKKEESDELGEKPVTADDIPDLGW